MYPAAFLRQPRDLTPIDRLASESARAHPQSSEAFWHALRALPHDVVQNVIEQGTKTNDAALIWSTLHQVFDDPDKSARSSAVLRRLAADGRMHVLNDVDRPLALHIYQQVYPEIVRAMHQERVPLERLRSSGIVQSIRQSALRNQHAVQHPENAQAIMQSDSDFGVSLTRTMPAGGDFDTAIVALSERFAARKVGPDDGPSIAEDVKKASYEAQVRALRKFNGKVTIEGLRGGHSSLRGFSHFHSDLLQSVIRGIDGSAVEAKADALDTLVRQKYAPIEWPVVEVLRDAVVDVRDHLETFFASREVRERPELGVSLSEAILMHSVFAAHPPDAMTAFLRGISAVDRARLLESVSEHPDVDLAHLRTITSHAIAEIDNPALSKLQVAKLRALDLLFTFDEMPVETSRENALRAFRRSTKYNRTHQIETADIGQVMTVVARVVGRRLLATPIAPLTEIPKVQYDRQIAPLTWLDQSWHHADEHQQRGIMLEILPHLFAPGSVGDEALPRWKERLAEIAAQPFHDEARPAAIDGTAFVRLIRRQCRKLRDADEVQPYLGLMNAAFDAVKSADDRTKYKVLSLFAADASAWKSPAFTQTLARRVVQDPIFGIQATLPHLVKRLSRYFLSATERAAIIRLSEQHLKADDLLAALACIASTVHLPVADAERVTDTFVTESNKLQHAIRLRLRAPAAERAATIDEFLDVRAASGAIAPVRFAKLPEAMQDEAAQFLPAELRASHLVNIVSGGQFPQTKRESVFRSIAKEYPTMVQHHRDKIDDAIARDLTSIPPHHFPTLCEFAVHRLDYGDLARVASEITDWHDPRIPYLTSKIEEKTGEQQLALALLHVAHILPPAATLKLWRTIALSWPESEETKTLHCADMLAEWIPHAPMEVAPAIHARALDVLTTSGPLQAPSPHRARLTNALFAVSGSLRPDQRTTLADHATSIAHTLTLNTQISVHRTLLRDVSRNARNLDLRARLEPSFVGKICERSLLENGADVEYLAFVEEKLQPLERQFEALRSDRFMMPKMPLPRPVREALLHAHMELAFDYERACAEMRRTIAQIAEPSSQAIAIVRFARILPEENLLLEQTELREFVMTQPPSALRDAIVTELDALRGDIAAEHALAELFDRDPQHAACAVMWRLRAHETEAHQSASVAVAPNEAESAHLESVNRDMIARLRGAAQVAEREGHRPQAVRYLEHAHRLGDAVATTILAGNYDMMLPRRPEIAERFRNLAGVLAAKSANRSGLTVLRNLLPENEATRRLLRTQRELITAYRLAD